MLVVGASGSGKSTFANCINGLIPFKTKGNITGELYINNQDATVSCLHDDLMLLVQFYKIQMDSS